MIQIRAVLAARARSSSRQVAGEWIGMYGGIIWATQFIRCTTGMIRASREVSDVWSRSVYGQVISFTNWECFERRRA